MRRPAALVASVVVLALVGCSGSDVEGGVESLRDAVTRAAARALDAIDAAKNQAGSVGQQALNEAAQAAEVTRQAIGGAGDELSAASKQSLEQAEQELEQARGALEDAVASAEGEGKEALERALAEVERLLDEVRAALE